ncbi:MAG TPA: GNAT family protein [Candidatus Paceibacterota bacterium]
MTEILETKRLILRLADSRDLPILAKWRATTDYLQLVSSVERKKYHLQFMVCLKRTNKSVGVLYTFSYNEVDGFMFLNIFLDERYRRNEYGAEACALAICHIFDNFPVYKIYCDSFSSNLQSVSMMKGIGLKQEGLLKGHRLYNGVRYDVARFAVHQENLGVLRSLLQKFKGR